MSLGTEHRVNIPKLEAGQGVRVEVMYEGLTCAWPRWGHDVQGVLAWLPPTPAALGLEAARRWPVLPATTRPTDYHVNSFNDQPWEGPAGRQSLTLGTSDRTVRVTLQRWQVRDAASPQEVLPTLAPLDQSRITASTWSGTPAWECELILDPIAHPGQTDLSQRL